MTLKAHILAKLPCALPSSLGCWLVPEEFSSVVRIFTFFFVIYLQSECFGAPWKVVACVWHELVRVLDKIMWSGSCYMGDWLFGSHVSQTTFYTFAATLAIEDSLCTRDSFISDYCNVLLIVHCSAPCVLGFSCDSEVMCTDVHTSFPPSLHCWHGGLRDSKVRDTRGHGLCIHTAAPLLQLSICT